MKSLLAWIADEKCKCPQLGRSQWKSPIDNARPIFLSPFLPISTLSLGIYIYVFSFSTQICSAHSVSNFWYIGRSISHLVHPIYIGKWNKIEFLFCSLYSEK